MTYVKGRAPVHAIIMSAPVGGNSPYSKHLERAVPAPDSGAKYAARTLALRQEADIRKDFNWWLIGAS
jgi:hypothetical protein